MMPLMGPPGRMQARSACLLGFVLSATTIACGPPAVADRAKGAAIAGGSGGGGNGGEGDTGGMVGTGGRDSTGGTGGSLPHDAATDPMPPPPDLAKDMAPPPPDLAADKAPDTGPEGGAGKTVLLVMGYSTPKDAALRPSDTKVKMRLEGRGFTVKLGDDDDQDASKATGTDLVIISETVGDTRVAAKYTMVPVPVICAHDALFDNMKMTGTAAADHATANVTQIVITDMTHPLAAGIMGSVTVSGGAQAASWGNPAATAKKIATIPNQATHAAIFGYEKGAMMNGLAAPAKRVGFFATETMTDGMNDNGWKLFDAAVDWAIAP
jgi:hypothetical protein